VRAYFYEYRFLRIVNSIIDKKQGAFFSFYRFFNMTNYEKKVILISFFIPIHTKKLKFGLRLNNW